MHPRKSRRHRTPSACEARRRSSLNSLAMPSTGMLWHNAAIRRRRSVSVPPRAAPPPPHHHRARLCAGLTYNHDSHVRVLELST